jgi:hypothetical protein
LAGSRRIGNSRDWARFQRTFALAAVYGGMGSVFDSNISERNHMADASANWSEQRRVMAPRIASVLYGVIAIMTVDLVVEPNRLKYAESTRGVLLIGLAVTITRIFIRVVTREAEIGAHLQIREYAAIIRDSLLVMLFPVITALLIVIAALTTTQWVFLLEIILYLCVGAVFVISFLSSYVLDRDIRRALSRGIVWVSLTLVLLSVKKLV